MAPAQKVLDMIISFLFVTKSLQLSFVITSKFFFFSLWKKVDALCRNAGNGGNQEATAPREWESARSVEPLPRVLLLLLVDHDADDDASNAGQKPEKKKEEQFDAGHWARLRVIDVITRGLEVARGRLDLGPVLRVGGLRLVELVQLHRHDVVTVGQVTWKK